MGGLRSLFRRAEPKPTMSVWPPAPPGACDICNAEVPDAGSARVPGDEFKKLVSQGYDPFASGRIGAIARALYAGTAQEAYEAWKTVVLRDTTDWAVCGACAADFRAFSGVRPDPAKVAFLEHTFGDELAAKLTDHLGAERAAAFAERTVAEAQARFTRFRDMETLTDEEEEEKSRRSMESGTVTIATRAVFLQEFMAERVLGEQDIRELAETADESESAEERIRSITRFVAQKIAGSVTSEAMRDAGLPDDRDLHLDIGARIYLTLIPMRVG